MKIITILTTLMLFSPVLYGQGLLKVESGSDLSQAVDATTQFLFDDFTDGRVFYKDAGSGAGKLNYNLLTGEFQFIDPKTKDTLAIANPENVLSVVVAGRQFMPFKDSEFIELLTKADGVLLAIRRQVKAIPYGSEGAYGTVSTTSSTSSYSSFEADGKQQQLSVSSYHQLLKDSFYYLVKGSRTTLINGSKSFISVFPKSKSADIKKYIEENKVNFKNEADLIKLLAYCNQLK